MRHLRFVLAALAIGAWAAGPLPSAAAQTAPTYQSSNPSKGEMMDHPPSEVTITFDQPLDQSSWVNVLDACGNEIDAGPATVDLNEMTVGIAKTPSGNYKVVYKAVGLAGATGSSGASFEFMVHHGTPCKGGHGGGHHPPGKGKGKHKGHEPGDDRDDHDDHDDGSGDSGHSGHSTMPGMSGSTHSGHTMAQPGHDGGHGSAGHGKHHGRGSDLPPMADAPENPPLAGGAGDVPVSADAEAVLLGLGLALAVGVLGGWLLRMSGNLSGA